MSGNLYIFRANVWLYPGKAGWHFVSLPRNKSAQIKALFSAAHKGWGSIPIIATVGKTTWRTSIFPEKKSGTYLLPIKAEARKKENILEGDSITISVEIRL